MRTTRSGGLADAPNAPPQGARTVEIKTWNGGRGVFWTQGNAIGVIWAQVPDHGINTPPPRGRWELGSEAEARRYFEAMTNAQRAL